MPAPMIIAKLPVINKFVHYGAILVLIGAIGFNLYQRFVREKKGVSEAVSQWVGLLALVVVILTWFIRQGTGV